MKIIGTMMVRDERDIVGAMVEHHLDQGLDMMIVTDNASVDGTTEVLQSYADRGVIELHHDPVHRKQQHSAVTQMARRARTAYAADWVVNADADEFFVPVDKSLTLRQALERIPVSLNAFTARVVNMVGPPADSGSGINRLLWRDHRSDRELQSVGIYAQPTPNAIHRGDPAIVVEQGNHYVSLSSNGHPDPTLAIEVYHLPWRSWSQLERKVYNAGMGYAANPELRPSKNHHGMADYQRYLGGRLREAYLLRTPLVEDLEASDTTGSYAYDDWLSRHLKVLTPRAVIPANLTACLDDPTDRTDPTEHAHGAAIGEQFHELEMERAELARVVEQHKRRVHELTGQVRNLRRDVGRWRAKAEGVQLV